MSKERRTSKRLSLELEAMYRRLQEDATFTTTVLNISFSGICIQVKDVIDQDSKVELKIGLETGEMVFLTAEVCWCRPIPETVFQSVGLRIVDGRDNDQAQFERYYNLRVLYPPVAEE